LRFPLGSRRKDEGVKSLRVGLDADLAVLVESYARIKGVSVEDALKDLARKGYDYHLLEEKYEDPSDPIAWDPVEKYRVALHGYLDCKLRLREIYSDLHRLVLLLSSLTRELEDCQSILAGNGLNPVISREELRLYREAVAEYMEKYVKRVRDSVERDAMSLEEVISDCRFILSRLEDRMRSSGGPRR